MPLTKNFKETVQARAQSDPAFRDAMFEEGISCLLLGDMTTGKAILRDYINATIGFESLGELTHHSPKSLMRMFSAEGNPQAQNLFAVIGALQQQEGVHLEVRTVR